MPKPHPNPEGGYAEFIEAKTRRAGSVGLDVDPVPTCPSCGLAAGRSQVFRDVLDVPICEDPWHPSPSSKGGESK